MTTDKYIHIFFFQARSSQKETNKTKQNQIVKHVYLTLETKFVSFVPNGILKISERKENPRQRAWKSVHPQDRLPCCSVPNVSPLECFLHLNLQGCILTTSTLLTFWIPGTHSSSMQENVSLHILNKNRINRFSM